MVKGVAHKLYEHPEDFVSKVDESEFEKFHGKALTEDFFRKDGEPVEVAMNIVVINLGDIDTVKQSFRMKTELWVAWQLTEKETKEYITDPDGWKPVFHPRPSPWTIHIEDVEMMRFATDRTTQVFIWEGKVVACECTLVTARYLERLELENFPFDCQHLSFHVGIRSDCDQPMVLTKTGKIIAKDIRSINGYHNFDRRTMMDVRLNPEACAFNVRNYLLSLQDFSLNNIEMEVENMPDDIPFLHCALRVSRNYRPYLYRVFVTMFLVLCTSTMAFRFPADVIGDRLSFIGTMLLTAVAFLFIISQWVPELAYLTLVDKYMVVCFVYIAFLGAQLVMFDEWDLAGDKEIETLALFANLGFIVVLHVVLSLYIAYLIHWERRKLNMNRKQVDRVYDALVSKLNGKADQFLADASDYVDADNIRVGGERQPSDHGWLYSRGGDIYGDLSVYVSEDGTTTNPEE